jgi:hypothetical protein
MVRTSSSVFKESEETEITMATKPAPCRGANSTALEFWPCCGGTKMPEATREGGGEAGEDWAADGRTWTDVVDGEGVGREEEDERRGEPALRRKNGTGPPPSSSLAPSAPGGGRCQRGTTTALKGLEGPTPEVAACTKEIPGARSALLLPIGPLSTFEGSHC